MRASNSNKYTYTAINQAHSFGPTDSTSGGYVTLNADTYGYSTKARLSPQALPQRETDFCKYCGTKIMAQDRGCVACGAPMRL